MTAYKVVNGTSYMDRTSDEVIEVLEKARQSEARIRVFYGDRETGRDWLEEHDTIGLVGRSCGSNRIPILLRFQNSSGGILDDCIVRITIDKYEAYRHAKYHIGKLDYKEVEPTLPSGVPSSLYKQGYRVQVFCDEKNVANFKTQEQADKYIAFIRGCRNKI